MIMFKPLQRVQVREAVGFGEYRWRDARFSRHKSYKGVGPLLMVWMRGINGKWARFNYHSWDVRPV